jgi:hypothetical protein
MASNLTSKLSNFASKIFSNRGGNVSSGYGRGWNSNSGYVDDGNVYSGYGDDGNVYSGYGDDGNVYSGYGGDGNVSCGYDGGDFSSNAIDVSSGVGGSAMDVIASFLTG